MFMLAENLRITKPRTTNRPPSTDHRHSDRLSTANRPPTHRQVFRLFIKCKIEPLSMGLSQLTEGLKCFVLLQVMRKNSSLFSFVFCPNDKLIWVFKSFTDMLQLVFSDDESSKKVREVTVYKRFADLNERCFWMVNNTSMLLFYESMKLHIVYQDFIYTSVYIISVHQCKLLCLLKLIFYTLRAP